jgi:eukaryotic-like serine/threonine-protein kinase
MLSIPPAGSISARPHPPMADAKLSWIGKYRDFELVGEGAMGVVYKAVDSVLGRTVAIKVMSDSIAQQEDLRKRFLREAQAAASLQHPNVVCIHDFGDADGHLFIAMEFIDGVDLERMIDRGEPRSVQAKLDVIIDVLDGLGFAHNRGIVHRDIKPANIRVGGDGRAKIMDFGVAHLMSSSMTNTGSILGTPSYMAPEQITEGRTSPGTDIFAVGAVLYQLLSSVKPFDGANLQNLLFRIATENPRPIRDLMPELPRELDRIVSKAMAKDPTVRYIDAADMANDLKAVRSKLGASPAGYSSGKSPRMRTLAYVGVGVLAIAALAAIVWPRSPQTARPISVIANGPAYKPVPSTPVVATAQAVAKPTIAEREAAPAIRRQNPEATSEASVRDAPVQEPLLPTTSAAVTAQPIVLPKQQDTTSPPPPVPTAADITPAVEAYARAIESRNINTIRSVEPGLTSEQQRSFEQFFQAAQTISVTLRIADVASSGSAASARLVGRYDYLNVDGQKERQPVSVSATLRHDGKVWRLVSVR